MNPDYVYLPPDKRPHDCLVDNAVRVIGIIVFASLMLRFFGGVIALIVSNLF